LVAGEAMLFTGAGFSCEAQDVAGRTVPSTEALVRELWDLCFPGKPRDASALQDLFHYALRSSPQRLWTLLRARLRVEADSLPEFYRRWFAVPWRRAYTLNVDDVEQAAARRFGLPRPIRSLSALGDPFDAADLERTDVLTFVHLNGVVHDGLRHVTFSSPQYGERLVGQDPWYAQFVRDLYAHPFVIVGTRLDEAPLWRHLQLMFERGASGPPRPFHRSFLVVTELTRARRGLLEDLNIHWIEMSSREFAHRVLADLPRADRPVWATESVHQPAS
jgi:hypothetical protein